MPNHIVNELSAPKHVIDSLQGDVGEVDFNTVLRMPAVLDGDCGMDINEWAQLAMTGEATIHSHFRKPTEFSDADFAMFLQRIRAIKETGFVSWYEWCCEHWGTKWNAYHTKRVNETTVRFQTAWATPLPVIEALSCRFPTDTLCLAWADEDYGANAGLLRMHNGVVTWGGKVENYSKEAYQLVLSLHFDGVVPDDMEMIDGRLEYKEESAA